MLTVTGSSASRLYGAGNPVLTGADTPDHAEGDLTLGGAVWNGIPTAELANSHAPSRDRTCRDIFSQELIIAVHIDIHCRVAQEIV